jgi:uncharacterized protein
MSQSKEPSMEEILSSIKRIIAEESDAPPRRPAPAPTEEPDVLELTQEFDEPEVASWDEPDAISAEEAPAIAEAPVAPSPPPETLISSASADATREALASLSRLVVKPENPAADNTLEGLVRELLRPMLKDWLDANLPGIVQATVDREVARIAGRTL